MIKKILFLIIFIVFGGTPSFATNYSTDASCAGFWKMNGASTAGETDYSGNGNDLTKSTGTISRDNLVMSGFLGGARKYSSGSLYRTTDGGTTDISGAGAKFSIVARISKDQYNMVDGATFGVAGKYDYASNNRQFTLNVVAVGTTAFKFAGVVSGAGTSATSVFSTTTNYSLNTWYKIAFVSNGTDLRLYVNGSLACTPVSYTAGVYNGTGVFSIGSRSNIDAFFSGKIDDVAVFSRDLSSTEVADIASYGVDGKNGAGEYSYADMYSTDGVVPSLATLNSTLDALVTANSSTFTSSDLGVSANNIDHLRAIIVTPTAGYTKTVLIDAGIHGDEWPPVKGALDLLGYLAAHPTKYPGIRFVVVCSLNPSGFVYPSAGLRANNNTVAGRKVDLNRNFNRAWATDTGSTDPANDRYKGPYAESEPEVAIFKTLLSTYHPNLYISNHSDNNWFTIRSGAVPTRVFFARAKMVAAGYSDVTTIQTQTANGESMDEAYESGVESVVDEWSNSDPYQDINRFLTFVDNMLLFKPHRPLFLTQAM